MDGERRGGGFDGVAELYDRVRPRYPAALVRELTERAGLGPGVRVLEIAPGTGQLTLPMAELGCAVTAVELGPSMAAVAARNLAGHPAVRVVTGAFERWPLPGEPFDAVACATAFHWLDPAVRTAKAADALRPGGVLAVVTTEHVAGGTRDFFAEVQRCYVRWDPAAPPDAVLSAPRDTLDGTARELAGSGRFHTVREWSTVREITYRTADYLDTLRSYSTTLALPEPARTGLLRCVGELIDGRYGGSVTKAYQHRLITGVRN